MELHQARDLVKAAMICLEAIPNPIYPGADESLEDAYEALDDALGPLESAADEVANLEAESIADNVAGDHSNG